MPGTKYPTVDAPNEMHENLRDGDGFWGGGNPQGIWETTVHEKVWATPKPPQMEFVRARQENLQREQIF